MANGGRMHRVLAPAGRAGRRLPGHRTGQADLPAVEDIDLVEYRRPSRYAESDRLLAFARDQFRGLEGPELLDAVVAWVTGHVTYLSGSSLPTDGATDTLLKRRGVCRDFAHLVVALLRAKDVPARLVSVYAPGLKPMDFHAVAEAYVDGAWHVVDATRLAPARVARPHRHRPRRDRHRVPLVLRRPALDPGHDRHRRGARGAPGRRRHRARRAALSPTLDRQPDERAHAVGHGHRDRPAEHVAQDRPAAARRR